MRLRGLCVFVFSISVSACGSSDNEPEGCVPATSTFEAIEQTIFDAKGCTQSTCHGQPAQSAPGNLDLRPGFAYDSLVRGAAISGASPLELVKPGDQGLSVLYWKLAARTLDDVDLTSVGVSGQGMPQAPLEAISQSELDAIAAWIRGGASQTAMVNNTESLFKCNEPFKAEPNKIDPLPAPDPAVGAQFYSGAYPLPANSETENCFVTYYDLSAAVPANAQFDCDDPDWGDGRKCFSFGRNELAQDGQSHHSIITVYTPEADPNSEDWDDWTCLGGDKAGEACDPTDQGVCGERGNCSTAVTESIACSGYDHAPSNFGGISLNGRTSTRVGLSGAQESIFVDEPHQGVYQVLPVQGFIAWNSHAFNLTDADTTIEQWVNVDFVPASERRWEGVSVFDVSRIFAMGTIQPYTSREVCHSVTLPQYTRLMSLSSHTHQHGVLFRTWLPTDLPSGKIAQCEQPSGMVGIFANDPNCLPETVEPTYLNRLYDDPLYLYWDDPLTFDDADPETRTVKMCAVFDNGGEDESTLYLNSQASQSTLCEDAPFGGFATSCGCAAEQRRCAGGPTPGAECEGDDTMCGEGGTCDACPVRGGLTTNDEMFVLLGSYYVRTPE